MLEARDSRLTFASSHSGTLLIGASRPAARAARATLPVRRSLWATLLLSLLFLFLLAKWEHNTGDGGELAHGTGEMHAANRVEVTHRIGGERRETQWHELAPFRLSASAHTKTHKLNRHTKWRLRWESRRSTLASRFQPVGRLQLHSHSHSQSQLKLQQN